MLTVLNSQRYLLKEELIKLNNKMLRYFEGVFILVQTTIGVGIIGIPYTISLSGIPTGIVFLGYFLLITYYSIHLLIKLKTQTFLRYFSNSQLSSIPLIAY